MANVTQWGDERLAGSIAYGLPAAGERWRHYKGGLYEVVTTGTHATSSLPCVVYRGPDGRAWVRALDDWHFMVKDAEHPGGVRRFVREEPTAA